MGNFKHEHFGCKLIMTYYLLLLFCSKIVCASKLDVVQEDHVKIVQAGENVNLTCTFSGILQTTTSWVKQTAEGKALHIVTFYLMQPGSWNKNLEESNRFNVTKQEGSFNLTIFKTKPSDSATYYCLVSSHYNIEMGEGTRLIVRDAVNRQITLQQSLIDTVHPGGSVNLQCTIFNESCAGEHSVYWFRQSLEESHLGVLYAYGEENGQCKKSFHFKTQSCVYNLLKTNLSHSDAGIYYCAVATCGEILFGNGAKLNFKESGEVTPTVLALGISNIIFFTLAVFLGVKLCRGQNKVPQPQENQSEDALNYATISFQQNTLNTRRSRVKISQEQPLYAHVRSHQ